MKWVRADFGKVTERSCLPPASGPSQPGFQELNEQLVDDAPALGKDALDRTLRGVAENDSIRADAPPAIPLERALQRLDVAPLSSQIAERSLQAPCRFRWKPPYEVDDPLGDLDLHRSSSAESGRKRVFPAR